MSEGKENPLKLPKRKIYEDEAKYYSRSGGIGGKGIDFPTIMRKEQENATKLPKAPPVDKDKISKN